MTAAADTILRFWTDEVGEAGWYVRDDAVDRTIRDRFMADWIDAPARIAAWEGSAEGALAALILTDQFPRNMFRGDARAFATDPMARALADRTLAARREAGIDPLLRPFVFLPFEHGEDLTDQDRSVALFSAWMPGTDNHDHAVWHRDVIAAFGRFPWRNADLGRCSTPAEQRLLDAGGYGAVVRGEVDLAALVRAV